MYYFKEFREEYQEYLVNPNDTLYNIAKNHNTTVDEIMKLNNLASTMIYPNQVLLIPTKVNEQDKKVVKDITYTTVNGDTINKIVTKTEKSFDTLRKYNNLWDLELNRGQTILMGKPTVAERKYYTIVNGDTLNSISQKTGLPVDSLVRKNEGCITAI